MNIFFSVGEPSGDLHGANLIRELRRRQPDLRCVGYGGPQMESAGCELHADLTKFAVMWFLRVLLNIHKFWGLACRADRYFRHHKPDAVVMIDYPGFNWWIARRAKAHGIPVFYYTPPQVWAWATWRVKKMRRFVDHVLCSLPFEEAWFRERGCRATFVGHPFFDEVRHHQFDEAFLAQQRARPGRLVTILPGSRTQEVALNLPWFLQAAARIQRAVPDVRLAIASFKPQQAQMAQEMVAASGLQVDVFLRKTPELIQLAECCLAVSGSVSLELLYQKKPTVVLYWINRFAIHVQSWFRKTKYITLVNLLTTKELFPKSYRTFDPDAHDAERVLFPEYLTCEDRSPQIAAHAICWLTNSEQREARIAELAELKAKIAHGGASKRAVEYILRELDRRPRQTLKTHFVPGMTLASSGGATWPIKAA
ncbi:MAG TPA: lipid-A-disaccharide synthase [Pirellulales bacterium]|jgi:lipid-A-disaccharide synthase|nr:lipid-A-disaccharide synthase [Pirellulales bacterium]